MNQAHLAASPGVATDESPAASRGRNAGSGSRRTRHRWLLLAAMVLIALVTALELDGAMRRPGSVAPKGLDVLPFPGTPDASPQSQIMFPALAASQLHSVQSYRAYRFGWAGQPTTRPSASVSVTAQDALRVYASWNGATKVARWRLLAGSSPSSLLPVAQTPRSGFETAISTTTPQPYLAVQALASSGHVLGTSRAISR